MKPGDWYSFYLTNCGVENMPDCESFYETTAEICRIDIDGEEIAVWNLDHTGTSEFRMANPSIGGGYWFRSAVPVRGINRWYWKWRSFWAQRKAKDV